MDTTEYLDVFIDESKEHLETLYQHLLTLEKNPSEKNLIDEIFRAAHTLKGMAATMGCQELAAITHKLENIFDGIRYDKIVVHTGMMDVLFDTADQLMEIVDGIAAGDDGKCDVDAITRRLEKMEKEEDITVEKNTVESPVDQDATGSLKTIQALNEFESSILHESADQGYSNYEVTVVLREDCILKGARVFMVFEVLEKLGEVIKSDPTVQELEEEDFDRSFTVFVVSTYQASELKERINKISEIAHVTIHHFLANFYKQNRDNQEMHEQKKEEQEKSVTETKREKPAQQEQKPAHSKTIRVNIDRLDVLMNLFEELVIDRGRLEQISLDLNHSELQETVERMTRVSSDLQSIILSIRMAPVDHVFNRFPRMIRQLARDLEKNVEIEIIGAETELDRTVIDEIGDPLVHLIRNAIDHGIERPDVRRQKGKTERGTIKLEAYHSGNHVFIEISDDGAGINRTNVIKKAIANEVITETAAKSLTDSQVYGLIMDSGFSTSDTVSDISGRGVGLDVVKNTIESLGGNISIHAESDKGSTFSVQLPLTLR